MAQDPSVDLGELEEKIQTVLGHKLTQTLAEIKAIQRVTQEIVSTERDIRRTSGIAADLEAEMLASSNDSLRPQLHMERDRVARLDRIRNALLSDLSELVSALEASSPAQGVS
jgi:hypothetical protein